MKGTRQKSMNIISQAGVHIGGEAICHETGIEAESQFNTMPSPSKSTTFPSTTYSVRHRCQRRPIDEAAT